MKRNAGLALVATMIAAGAADAQTIDKRSISLQGAVQVIEAAVAEALRNKAGGAIAVVDDGGNLVALHRIDGTFAAGANIAIGKARTAALFQRPTSFFEDVINKGRTSMTTLADFTPLQGGVPILADGRIVGAVGVSGAMSAKQDDEIATLAAAAVSPAAVAPSAGAAPSVAFFDASRVSAAFRKGEPLVELPGFKVHASRRDAPGQGEVHLWETDVFYVQEGTATFVTGGTLVDPKVGEPGELRGSAIAGGTVHQLKKGDVITIPAGTPHWFKDVQAPFVYFVVKPIAQKEHKG